MKNREADKLYVLKMIKAKFLEFQTSKGFKEDDFTDVKEISILQKMEKTWSDERDMFVQAGRDVSELNARLEILRQYLPKPVSEEEIRQAVIDSGFEPVMKNMKVILQFVQSKYPSASGKEVSSILKEISNG